MQSVYSEISPIATKFNLVERLISVDSIKKEKLIIQFSATFDSSYISRSSFLPNEIVIEKSYLLVEKRKQLVLLPKELRNRIESILCEKKYYVERLGNLFQRVNTITCIVYFDPNCHQIKTELYTLDL